MLNRKYQKLGWTKQEDAIQANTFNETFDNFMRVSARAWEEAYEDPEGPIGPFKNCFVCSVPPGGKHLEGNCYDSFLSMFSRVYGLCLYWQAVL